MSWQNSNNPFGQRPGVPTHGDDEELTPPSGHALDELSAPRWNAPPATGSFHAPSLLQGQQNPQAQQGYQAQGSFQAPGYPAQQPQHPSQVQGQFSSAGFTPPVGGGYQQGHTPAHPGMPQQPHATGAFNTGPIPNQQPISPYAQPQSSPYVQTSPHVQGQYSSPGFTPPSATGAFQVGPTPASGYQQPPTPAAGYYTGGFGAVSQENSSVMESMTGTFNVPNLIQQQQQQQQLAQQEESASKRISFAIWGGAVGAIIGILLGVLNAILEGVPLYSAQTPLILLGIICMMFGAGFAAYAPNTFEQLLRQFDLLPDDD